MFTGDSCFPISAIAECTESAPAMSSHDQLIMITRAFELDKSDCSFITRKMLRDHHKKVLSQKKNFSFFEERISKSSPALVQVLKLMLTYNPAFRPTAK